MRKYKIHRGLSCTYFLHAGLYPYYFYFNCRCQRPEVVQMLYITTSVNAF